MKDNINNFFSQLDNSNKELDCLYHIDEILTDYISPIEEIAEKIIEIIPDAFRHSQIAKVQININELQVQSEDFKLTELKLVEPIIAEGENVGDIIIIYAKKLYEEKGIFLAGERQLIKNIAQKLGSYFYYRKLRETIENLQKSEITPEPDSQHEMVMKWLSSMNLNKMEIEQMLKVKIDFGKGETIIKQGALASYVILLVDGLSKNYLEGNNEKGFIFKIIKPINFIGLSALYSDNTYAFSGSALSNCSAYLIDSQVFKNIITKNHEFSKKIFNWYCSVTHGHLQRMSSLANKQSLGRFAEILLYLSDEIFNGPIITKNVSRKDIAELAAISTESGVRFLSDLKKDKIIDIHPSNIEILNHKILKVIAG